MQLFLDYDKLLHQRLTSYISNDYICTVIDVLRKLHADFQTLKERRKNQPQTDLEDVSQELEMEKEDEEGDDSFIDDREAF